jgi:hypothetical protein
MRSALLRRRALGKFEVTDARAPVETGRRRVVFVCVIERTIVSGINSEIAVIAPAIGRSTLAAGPIEKMLLAGQGIQWVCRQTPRVTDLRVN